MAACAKVRPCMHLGRVKRSQHRPLHFITRHPTHPRPTPIPRTSKRPTGCSFRPSPPPSKCRPELKTPTPTTVKTGIAPPPGAPHLLDCALGIPQERPAVPPKAGTERVIRTPVVLRPAAVVSVRTFGCAQGGQGGLQTRTRVEGARQALHEGATCNMCHLHNCACMYACTCPEGLAGYGLPQTPCSCKEWVATASGSTGPNPMQAVMQGGPTAASSSEPCDAGEWWRPRRPAAPRSIRVTNAAEDGTGAGARCTATHLGDQALTL